MKATERMIVLGLLILGMLAAFWFLIISPKREEVSKLDDEITTLEASVAEQEQLAAFAQSSESDYEGDFESLVVLGKAVPGDDDSASLIEQTQGLAERAGVEFRALERVSSEGAGATAPAPAPAPAAPPAGSETTPAASETAPATGSETPAATPTGSEAPATTTTDSAAAAPAATDAATATGSVPATEAAAASLPIGATVGPAGLPVLPYDFTFRGDFFQIADFMAGLDGMVRVDAKGIGVDGRLVTVDGFSLTGDQAAGFPMLEASLHVNTYVAPPDQGTTAGATVAAPAPVSAAAPAPAAPAPAPTSTTPAP